VCCSVVLCGAVWCLVVQFSVTLRCSTTCVTVCCSVLQCVVVCCIVLQCVAAWNSVVQRGVVWCYFKVVMQAVGVTFDSRCVDADDSRVTY